MVGSRLQNPSVLISFRHHYINVPCTLTTQIHTLLHSIAEVCWYIYSGHIFMQTLIAPKLKLTAVAVNCATILRNSQRQCQIQFLYQWSGMLLPHKLENKSVQFNCQFISLKQDNCNRFHESWLLIWIISLGR